MNFFVGFGFYGVKINMAVAKQGQGRRGISAPDHKANGSHDAAAFSFPKEVKWGKEKKGVKKKGWREKSRKKINADAMTLNDPVRRRAR